MAAPVPSIRSADRRFTFLCTRAAGDETSEKVHEYGALASSDLALFLFLRSGMHGTYRHRITCNLHPHQYYPVVQAAQQYKMPKALFLRDAALAYLQKKTVLPTGVDERLKSIQLEVQSIESVLQPIVSQADALKRVTPRDLRRAAKAATHLDHQLTDLLKLLATIPHDH